TSILGPRQKVTIGHAVWGQRMVLGDVRDSEMPVFTKHMLRVIWNQPTVFHFLSAIVLILASLAGNPVATTPLVIFIGAVSFGFFLNYVGTSLIKNRSALLQIIPQAIAVIVYLDIIAVGIHG
ncbi:MAG: hypothetical protein ABI700_20345, partial [Chloroflexota bacterium]